MELAHTPCRKTRTCSPLDGKVVGQVCTKTLELASHFPMLTNLTALQQWPDLSWTRDKLRGQTCSPECPFASGIYTKERPYLANNYSPHVRSPQHTNLIPSPSHLCPDLCQQRFYSTLQTGFTAFLGQINAMPALATERVQHLRLRRNGQDMSY